MNNQPIISKKKAILAIGGVFLVLILIFTFFYIRQNQAGPNGDYLEIQNLDELTKGKPSDRDTLNFIKESLYNTVSLNVDNQLTSNSIEDVVVREGSFSQTYDESTTIHTVSFIVDIESLQQSYQVSYQWSTEDRASDAIDEWGTITQCLPVDKLIYGDFNCKDMFTEMQGATDPALEAILPYETTYYTVRYFMEDNETPVISIVIKVNTNSQRTINRFMAYKDEAIKWLRSKDINPDDYEIRYRNLLNEPVSVD